ncbi:MAG: MFS transporter [Acetobacteraceae bacterium]|nr:MFS transporter [Acetobacteraceae bacterium]
MSSLALVAFGVVFAALSMGLRQSFGLFLTPITLAHGWSASVLAFALAVQVLPNGVFQPLCGNLADRFGSRQVLWGGAVLYALGIALMAAAGTYLVFLLAAGPLLGLAISAAGFPVVMAALQRALPEGLRPRAIGLVTAGSSFGQFSVVPLVATGIGAFGWEATLYAMAAAALLMVFLATPLTGDAPAGARRRQRAGDALAGALRSLDFWCLFGGFFVCGVHVSFLSTHLPGFAALCGLHPWYGGAAISAIGLFNIFGSLLAGELAGRWRRRELLVFIYAARAVVMALFMAAPKTELNLLIFSAAMGLLWLSTVPPTVQLTARLFGTQWLATIFGLVYLGHQIGGFAGAWLGGVIFDRTGSYDLMWWIAIGCGVFAALINLPMRDPMLPRAVPAH